MQYRTPKYHSSGNQFIFYRYIQYFMNCGLQNGVTKKGQKFNTFQHMIHGVISLLFCLLPGPNHFFAARGPCLLKLSSHRSDIWTYARDMTCGPGYFSYIPVHVKVYHFIQILRFFLLGFSIEVT